MGVDQEATVAEERIVTTSDGVDLWTVAAGSGPPLVLLHGGPGLWDDLGALADLLVDRHTVVRWDQRGCGRSGPASEQGLDATLRDLDSVRRAWDVEHWAVLGHSFGAYLALLAALDGPAATDAVVYLSGIGDGAWWRGTGRAAHRAERERRRSPADRSRLAELAAADRTATEEVEHRRLSWSTDFADPSSPPALLDEMAAAPFPIRRRVNEVLNAAHAEDVTLAGRCADCDVPALFLHGSQDPRPADGARMLADRMPRARFVAVDGAGHFPWAERPDAVRRVILDHLALHC